MQEAIPPTYYVPPLPLQYVSDFSVTSTTLESVMLRSFDDQGNVHIVNGMAGTGKTSATLAVGSHSSIFSKFRDAIWFLSVAKNIGITEFVKSLEGLVRSVVNDAAADAVARLSLNTEYMAAAVNAIISLNSCSVLLLLDDLSSFPVRKGSLPSVFSAVKECLRFVLRTPAALQIFITTRDDTVADIVPRRLRIHSSPLPPRAVDAQSILRSYAGFQDEEAEIVTGETDSGFTRVLDRCAGLQLALSIAGAAVQDMVEKRHIRPSDVWDRYAADLERSSVLFSDPTPDHPGLFVMIESSLDAIVEMVKDNPVLLGGVLKEEEIRLTFCGFAVFRKQERIPCEVLECWWKANATGVFRVCEVFSNLNLVSLKDENGTFALHIHDLVHDFCIHESAGLLIGMHCGLLDQMYANLKRSRNDQPSSQSDRDWWLSPVADRSAAFQAYLTKRVTWHLKEGHCHSEYLSLVLDYRWAECRILRSPNGNDITGICSDIDSLVDRYMSATDEEIREGLRLISSAFKLSASYISMNNREIPFQIGGRLRPHQDRNSVVKSFLSGLYRHAEVPWVLPQAGVLKPPGGFAVFQASIHKSVSSIALLSDDMEIVLGTTDGDLKFFSIQSRCAVHELQGLSEGTVIGIEVCEKEDLMVAASSDGRIRLLNLSTRSEITSSPFVTEVLITCIALTKNGLAICIGGNDGSVQLWELRTVTMKWMTRKSQRSISELVILDEKNIVVSCSVNGELQWLDLDSGEERKPPSNLAKEQVLHFSINCNRSLYVLVSGIEISAHNLSNDECMGTYRAQYKRANVAPSSMKCSPTHPDMVYFGDVLGTIRIWNIKKDSIDVTINAHSDAVTSIRFRNYEQSEGREVVTASKDGSVCINRVNVNHAGVHEAEQARVMDMVTVPHRNRLLYFLLELWPLYLYDLTKGSNGLSTTRVLKDESLKDHKFAAIKCTPDGRLAIIGMSTGALLVIDTEKWEQRSLHLSPHSHWITALDVAVDGSLVAAGCYEGLISLWKLADQLVTPILLHPDKGERDVKILKLMVGSDGMVAVFGHGTLRIWDWGPNHVTPNIVGTFSLKQVCGHNEAFRLSIIATKSHVLSRGMNESCFQLFDIRTRERRKVSLDESDDSGLLSIMRARYEARGGDGVLSVPPFGRQLIYTKGSARAVVGTLEEPYGFNFDADNWSFDKSAGLFVAGCKLKPLLSTTLISEKGKSAVFTVEELSSKQGKSEPKDDEGLEDGEEYFAFLSHAGNDKFDIAIPLYHELKRRGLHSFVDRKELRPGEDAPAKMVRAMETARVGVFILSPEFAARRWPLRELVCFLDRHEKNDAHTVLIPVFYRLTVHECRDRDLYKWEKADGSSLFLEEGFFEPDRQAEASTNDVMARMKAVTTFTGIRNEEGAKNANEDASEDGVLKRQKLIERIADAVVEAKTRMDRAPQSRERGRRSLCMIT